MAFLTNYNPLDDETETTGSTTGQNQNTPTIISPMANAESNDSNAVLQQGAQPAATPRPFGALTSYLSSNRTAQPTQPQQPQQGVNPPLQKRPTQPAQPPNLWNPAPAPAPVKPIAQPTPIQRPAPVVKPVAPAPVRPPFKPLPPVSGKPIAPAPGGKYIRPQQPGYNPFPKAPAPIQQPAPVKPIQQPAPVVKPVSPGPIIKPIAGMPDPGPVVPQPAPIKPIAQPPIQIAPWLDPWADYQQKQKEWSDANPGAQIDPTKVTDYYDRNSGRWIHGDPGLAQRQAEWGQRYTDAMETWGRPVLTPEQQNQEFYKWDIGRQGPMNTTEHRAAPEGYGEWLAQLLSQDNQYSRAYKEAQEAGRREMDYMMDHDLRGRSRVKMPSPFDPLQKYLAAQPVAPAPVVQQPVVQQPVAPIDPNVGDHMPVERNGFGW